MDSLSFSNLLNTLEQQDSLSSKESIIRTATTDNTLTSGQISQVIEKLNFSKEQEQILEILRPKKSGMENLLPIMEAFDLTTDNTKDNALFGEPVKKPPKSKSKQSTDSQETKTQQVIKSSSFSALLNTLDEQNFPKEQLYLIELAAYRNQFSSEQVVQLLEKIQFPRQKLKALKILRYKITDTGNHFLILKAFVHSLSKKKATALLKNEENNEEFERM
jgi:hypothetical protein